MNGPPPAKSSGPSLTTPVQYVKGVGPQRAQPLARLGIETAEDLLFNFPRDYQDLTNLDDVRQMQEGTVVRLRGQVAEVDCRQFRQGRETLGVLLNCQGGAVRLLWFNQPYLKGKIETGQQLLVTGKPKLKGMVWQMAHPNLQWIDTDENLDTPTILPVYSLTEGISQRQMRTVTKLTIESHAQLVEESLPTDLILQKSLLPISVAIRDTHFPPSREALELAKKRIAYEELFLQQVAMAVKRHLQKNRAQARHLPATSQIDARIQRLFPFELTAGQRHVIAEITADMAQNVPMTRLLQGDVGSGKTVVAAYAMLVCVAHHQQAVLMAPTEVLARQHARTMQELLSKSKVRIALLVGGLTSAERIEARRRVREGEADIIVGTQAVVQSDVEFSRLALVVIDEQHKFGVMQRALLKHAGLSPHYLVMTATPIPRTIALTQFGDLDLSVLKESPAGRHPVHTYLVNPERHERWWTFYGKMLQQGCQGYVIAPLVEDSEKLSTASVESVYEQLASGPLEAFRLGLMHGRMSTAEKERVMGAFRQGELQVLVSTSVIEVGIDVPNATLMAILGADRFGLSQLHQLRGRIVRGIRPGYCAALLGAEAEEAAPRLKAFVETTDGFKIAEADLALRGAGELLGTRQHGRSHFHIADLARDVELVEECRQDAQQIVARDPGLSDPRNVALRRALLRFYGDSLQLSDVG